MLIKPDDVARVFDGACVRELATLARLPAGTDLARFGDGVRLAVQNAIARASEPTPNSLHHEIAALYRAAERCEPETRASLIQTMTPAARRIIAGRQAVIEERRASFGTRKGRLARLADIVPDWRIPDPAELCDPGTREKSAEDLRALLSVGTAVKERKRPSGKPTESLVPRLYAPKPSRAEPRRAAERMLVMWLQVAVAETRAKVALTAHYDTPGPFAQMVARVVELAGLCPGEIAVGRAVRAINDVHEMHRKKRKKRRRTGGGDPPIAAAVSISMCGTKQGPLILATRYWRVLEVSIAGETRYVVYCNFDGSVRLYTRNPPRAELAAYLRTQHKRLLELLERYRNGVLMCD
jgi:hypothetical protein